MFSGGWQKMYWENFFINFGRIEVMHTDKTFQQILNRIYVALLGKVQLCKDTHPEVVFVVTVDPT